jgi:predicted nucleic acid-binding Zn ribbon protein
MPRPNSTNDDWDDDSDDWEEDSDDDSLMPCPYCDRPIHNESVRCPHCGNYLSEEDAPRKPKPLWLILAALACLLAVLTWILGR